MSRRNRLTLAEQETIILWDNELDIASVYTHDQRIANKLKELAKKYPDQFRVKEKGPHRSVTYEVPKRCVNIRPPYNEARRQQQIKDAAAGGTLIQKWDEINGTGSSEERMEAFLTSENDTYAILQLSFDQPEVTAYERFESLNGLARQGKQPNIDHYEVVYTAPLLPYKDLGTMLEEMYTKFNIDHPEDFRGHSLSVSDIVAIRQNGIVSCHYVDSIGFKELPEFLKPENYLKNAEMAMEDDYGMIDGIINNGKADRIREAEEKRPSVLEQLKAEPPQIDHPERPRRPEERNIV